LEALIWVLLLIVVIGFFFWKYPDLLKGAFFPEKKTVEQAKPVTTEIARMPKYGQTGYEDIGSINEPLQPPVVKVPRHEIIKHDYYNAYANERWPQWHCKCGDSGYAITTVYESLEATEREARRDGQDHVRKATIIDERLEKTNGNFAF
jgi:hypothetical protein